MLAARHVAGHRRIEQDEAQLFFGEHVLVFGVHVNADEPQHLVAAFVEEPNKRPKDFVEDGEGIAND